ncbi:MAG: hypothetical protein LC802_03120 [Acidobacteria bacterium]|nr:hypothetical protein [Acidobacteriota bacterium]
MRRSVLAALIALVVLAGGAAFYYFRHRTQQPLARPLAGREQDIQSSRVAAVRETPLPNLLQQPGLVSRRFAPMRLYVSVAPEIAIKRTDGGADSSKDEILDIVPILIVLENDSYQEVDARRDLKLEGEELFNVFVTHSASGIVFRHSEPAVETVWGPAERKTFKVPWQPTIESLPGECVISMRLAFGGSDEVQIRTRLK